MMKWKAALLIAAMLFPTILPAQVTIGPEGPVRAGEEKEPDRNQPQVYELMITPAPEPIPALEYRFDVPLAEQKPGNSVPFLYRAVLLLNAGNSEERQRKLGAAYNKSSEAPLAEFPAEEARELLGYYSGILKELERATERTDTNWNWHMEELRALDWISFRLEEIQEMRELGRILYIKARLELAERRFADAEQTLRTGFHLARATGEEPLIINKLVGCAIAGMMTATLLDWIAIEDSPNIYWALASLPDPLIDMRPAIEYELQFPFRTAPWLRNAAEDAASPVVWRDRFITLLRELVDFNGSLGPLRRQPDGSPPSTEAAGFAATAIALAHYPRAKQALIDRGFSSARVSTMPVGKVIAIRQAFLCRLIIGELAKGSLVASAASHEIAARTEESLKKRGLLGPPSLIGIEPFPLMSLLTPATRQSLTAETIMRSRLRGMRTLEAIRMHVADRGALPDSLNEVEIVPVPNNPLTGRPFDYSLSDDKATLHLMSHPSIPVFNWRIEIKLRSSDND